MVSLELVNCKLPLSGTSTLAFSLESGQVADNIATEISVTSSHYNKVCMHSWRCSRTSKWRRKFYRKWLPFLYHCLHYRQEQRRCVKWYMIRLMSSLMTFRCCSVVATEFSSSTFIKFFHFFTTLAPSTTVISVDRQLCLHN